MRMIAKSRLRQFWSGSPACRDAKRQMTEWYNFCEAAEWNTPHEFKADIRTASILKNNRVVFNLCGNKYRIVVLMDYIRRGMLTLRVSHYLVNSDRDWTPDKEGWCDIGTGNRSSVMMNRMVQVIEASERR